MAWTDWVVVILMGINAAYMTFDGFRALRVGDYLTATTGKYAGQLGPWSKVVAALGIQPRSTLMKLVFVGYGLLTILMVIAFILHQSWAGTGLVVMAVLGLWYLPFGTITGIISIILLLLSGR